MDKKCSRSIFPSSTGHAIRPDLKGDNPDLGMIPISEKANSTMV